MTVHHLLLREGLSLRVEDQGEGRPIIMLHAGVSEHHMWDAQWPRLVSRMRAIRFDWPGFGETPHVPGPFSYADDVLRILDALDIRQATLMGCSFAGSVAIQVALQHPERIGRLVLVSSGVPGFQASSPAPELDALFSEADQAFLHDNPARALELMEQIWLIGPRRHADSVNIGYLQRARALLQASDRPDEGAVSVDQDFSAVGVLDHIRVPILVIVGDEDVPEVIESAHYLAQSCPNVELHEVHDAAHLPNMEKPEAFNHILFPWLENGQ
ncbi:alpha/beta fold hydrolase [Sulfobacillus thermosulfidooxidans]|uniref:alpha/beta fold hydrolase n=1 Tax=Sulfobacillus thermosulfidooxidans TaxID=28034 RepID=UPI0002EA2AD9|nr:alpha/beta hydrolase [Sulfobacillus thermosulfidooxidans]